VLRRLILEGCGALGVAALVAHPDAAQLILVLAVVSVAVAAVVSSRALSTGSGVACARAIVATSNPWSGHATSPRADATARQILLSKPRR